VAEVSDEDGRFLIGAKKAELADAPEKKMAVKATKAGKEKATLTDEDKAGETGDEGKDK
jgi:hypothetical protein